MGYSFRIRFILPDQIRVGIESEECPLTPEGSIPKITLRSKKPRSLIADSKELVPKLLISDSKELVLRGDGYSSEEEAWLAGEHARDAITRVFARLRMGADFGDRAPKGVVTNVGLKMLEQQAGERVLNDVHGLMTFETEPSPVFVGVEVKASLKKSPEKFVQALRLSLNFRDELKLEERVSFDLFGASFFNPSPDARLVLLMMAVETLLKPEPRSSAVKQHVDELIRLTKESTTLPEDEKKSLLGSLEQLYTESIGQAGRKLAKKLGNRKYLGHSPREFFTYCYNLRSWLVHGDVPPPTREEVDQAATKLQDFVGDLLSGPLLQQVTL